MTRSTRRTAGLFCGSTPSYRRRQYGQTCHLPAVRGKKTGLLWRAENNVVEGHDLPDFTLVESLQKTQVTARG